MARLSLVLVVVVGALAGCGAEGAGPTIPPPHGPPRGSLLVLETEPCNWLPPPDPDHCDAVSPGRIGLHGEPIERLTTNVPVPLGPISISSDGTELAWAWNWEVAVMGVDGADPRLVSRKQLPGNLAEFAFHPTWSPDGSELLYRWAGADGAHTWFRMNVASGERTEVQMPVECGAMAWFPEGGSIVCEVWPDEEDGDGGETDLYRVDLESLEAAPLTDLGDGISAFAPDWSPDGRWLAFSLNAFGDASASDTNGIWILDVEGGESRRVAGGAILAPEWSPDGGHLIAYDDDAGRLVIVGRDGSGLVTIDHEPRQFVHARWLPDR